MTGTTGPTGSAGPTGSSDAASSPGRSGPPLLFAVLAIGSLVFGALLIVVSMLGPSPGPAVAPTTAPVGQAARVTRELVVKALGDASFQVRDPVVEYRSGESPELYAAPRGLVQVIVPSEPQGEYVVIYELASANDADRVGAEFAAYLAGGTGAVQYPRDSQFVIRRVGPTLVFFAWSPSVSPDARVAELAAALETVGTPVTAR